MILEFREVKTEKKRYLDLLLLADEQEDMVDRYLEEGEMFALYDGGEVKCTAVVLALNESTCELKNIATDPEAQGKGYGKAMVSYLLKRFGERFDTMLVGTGDHPKTLGFYEACGFRQSHRVENFFTDNYREPIIDDGVLLVDMVYLKIDLKER